MMDYDDQGYLEPLEPQEPEKPQRSFFGMSPIEIGILVVLLVVIFGLVGFVVKSVYDNSKAAAETPPPPPTATLVPTVPANATSTPWPTAAAINDWNKFEFAGGRGSLWLPNGFQGGDPIAYPDIVMMTVETYSDDEVFIQSVDDLLSENPEINFFAFDPAVIEWPRVAAVSKERFRTDWLSYMDAYL
jgi:hypothetical protein